MRLDEPGPDREREAAAPGPRVLGHELHRLPAVVCSARPGSPASRPTTACVSCGDVHVADGEELDRPSGVERRVVRRRRVGDRARPRRAAAAPAAPPRGRGCPSRRPRRSPGTRRSRSGRRRAGRCGRPRPRCPFSGRARSSRATLSPSTTAQTEATPAAAGARRGGARGAPEANDFISCSHRRAPAARAVLPSHERQRRGEGQRDARRSRRRSRARSAEAVKTSGTHSSPTSPVARLRKRKTSRGRVVAAARARPPCRPACRGAGRGRRAARRERGPSPGRAGSGRRRPPRQARR